MVGQCEVEPGLVVFGGLLFPPDAKERRIAMFGAFFDDSATPGTNPVMLSMACYVASDVQWDAFRVRWQELLDREELPYVHMADLTFRNHGCRIAPYKGWDDEREKRFLQDVHSIIHDTIEAGVAMSVDIAAYKGVITADINKCFGGPYGFCVFLCLLKIDDYAKQRDWKEPVACFFESKSGYGHEITTLQQKMRKGPSLTAYFKMFRPKTWTFTDKLTHPQLQAADVYAYESNHFMHNLVFGDQRKTKDSFINLILRDAEDHWGVHYDKAKLREFVQNWRETRQRVTSS